jgi:hypothetical protein
MPAEVLALTGVDITSMLGALGPGAKSLLMKSQCMYNVKYLYGFLHVQNHKKSV